MSVPIPPGTKAKMMDIVISRNKLKLGLKGQPPIIEVWPNVTKLPGSASMPRTACVGPLLLIKLEE